MDRMTPPPNYYGATFPGFNQGQGAQPPMPNGNVNNPNMNNAMPNQMPNQNINPNAAVPTNFMANPYTAPAIESETGTCKGSNCVQSSYAEIAHSNRGKHVRLYCSFPDSSQWHDVIIEGKIHYAADDHIAIESDTEPGKYILIIGIYVNYMELFEKPIVPNKKSN